MSDKKQHVIVKPFKTKGIRQPIEVLMSKPEYKKQRDLFLQGFAKVQQRGAKDPRSFFAVAGIHGLPYEPYDLLPGEQISSIDWHEGEEGYRWGGYCHHGDILFPTWHRPYVLLLEMLIYEAAEEIVNKYDDGPEADEYRKELEKVRFPYWDWASPSTLTLGIPSVILDEYVYIDDPIRKDIKMPNPLRAYTLPVDLGTLSLIGDISNPTQRPYSPDATVTPYTPEGYATVRHPDSNYLTNADATNLNVVTFCSSTFRPSIYQVFLVNDWVKFSNHGANLKGELDGNYGHFSSIEVVHDAVHDAVGGNGGHMSYPDIASFDPIFFLHHANVDRLFAIWQACNPGVWITGNNSTRGTFTDEEHKLIDQKTDLTPFHKTEDTYWNSDDVRDIKALGYSYPEIESDKPTLLIDMLNYYHPNIYLLYDWKLTLTVKKYKVGSPFQIRVFIDLPDASASTPCSSSNFAGRVYIFARGKETSCANCISNPEAVVNGNVDLTACMRRLSIDINMEPQSDGTIDPSKPDFKPSLKANQITLVAVLIDGTTEISLEKAGLITADYWAIEELNNNQPDQWKSIYIGKVYPSSPIQLKCGIRINDKPHKKMPSSQDTQDKMPPFHAQNKIFVVEPNKEDKVAVLKFAIKTLLENDQDYKDLSSNFDLYVNDPQETVPMNPSEVISKYLYQLLTVKNNVDNNEVQILIQPHKTTS